MTIRPTLSSTRAQALSGQLVAFFAALAFCSIPWPEIFEAVQGIPLNDRTNYINKTINYSININQRDFQYWYEFVSGEYLWGFILSYFSQDLNIDVEILLWVISLFTIYSFINETRKYAGWAYVPLLICPLIVMLAFDQSRIALAMSVVLPFWRQEKGTMSLMAIYAISSMIHTAMIAVAIMHLSAHFFRDEKRSNLLALVLVGGVISVVTGPAKHIFLSFINDRRAETENLTASLSYMSFWIVAFLLTIWKWRSICRSVDGRLSVIVLSLCFVNVFTDGYSTRWLAIFLPSIIVAFKTFPSTPVSLPVILFIPYNFMLWLYWFRVV